jgi:hypothetical protein
MNVAHQIQQAGILLTEDGFVAVRKKIPVTPVVAVEARRVGGTENFTIMAVNLYSSLSNGFKAAALRHYFLLSFISSAIALYSVKYLPLTRIFSP